MEVKVLNKYDLEFKLKQSLNHNCENNKGGEIINNYIGLKVYSKSTIITHILLKVVCLYLSSTFLPPMNMEHVIGGTNLIFELQNL